MPANIRTYITANYEGYTFHKAYAIKNSSAVVAGYVAIIYYYEKPAGIEFDSTSNLVKVMEQRKKGDLNDKGHHRGGRFEQRDGEQNDTLALVSQLSIAANYLSQTYPNYLFKKAFSITGNGLVRGFMVVIDANNTKYAVELDTTGNLVGAKTIQ